MVVEAAERAWAAVGRWTAHHADNTLAEDGALATRATGDRGDRSAVCGELPMAEGRHWAEFTVVEGGYQTYVGVAPAEFVGKVAGVTDSWNKEEPAVHMWKGLTRRTALPGQRYRQ